MCRGDVCHVHVLNVRIWYLKDKTTLSKKKERDNSPNFYFLCDRKKTSTISAAMALHWSREETTKQHTTRSKHIPSQRFSWMPWPTGDRPSSNACLVVHRACKVAGEISISPHVYSHARLIKSRFISCIHLKARRMLSASVVLVSFVSISI
jgi:hypothetical protein